MRLTSQSSSKIAIFTVVTLYLSTPSLSFTTNYKNSLHLLDRKNKLECPVTSCNALSTIITTPLIAASDKWGNIACLSGAAALSQQCADKTKIGKLLGGPVTAMALAFLLGSIGILPPGGSTGCKALQTFSLQLATPLILLGADLRGCQKTCGPLIPSFILASLGTMLGCGVFAAISSTKFMLTNALGADGIKIAAALMAKNIGGGINYISVCQALSASPISIAAGLCVDNIFALIYFPITSILGSKLPDLSSASSATKQKSTDDLSQLQQSSSSPLQVNTVSTIIAITSLLIYLGGIIANKVSFLSELPAVTAITLLFILSTPNRFLQNIRKPCEVFGTSLLYLFFATAGAPGFTIARSLRSSFIPLFSFLSCLYGVHGLFLYMVRKFVKSMKSNDEESQSFVAKQRLLVASSAAIGGPATSVALCSSCGWKSLVVPSIIVGNLIDIMCSIND